MEQEKMEYVKKYKERKVEPFYLVINVVYLELYLEDNSRTSCYVILGSNGSGKRKYITSIERIDEKRVSEWYDIIQVLKKRGLESIIYVIMPEDKNLKEALKLNFKDVEIYESYEKVLDKMKKYMPRKEYEPMIPKLKGIYIGETKEEYRIKKEEFEKRYVTTELYKYIVGKELEKAEKAYELPYKLRKFIYSFYGANRMYVRLKGKHLSKKYRTLEEYIESMGEIIDSYESEMSMRRKEWGEIVNEVFKLKGEEIKKYI